MFVVYRGMQLSIGQAAQLCDSFEMYIFCVDERGLQFTGIGLGVWLSHWPYGLGEFVVCV